MDTRFTLAAAVLSLLSPALAGGGPDGPAPAKHVAIELLCDHQTVAPGSTVSVALKLTIDPGWHVYWNGLNDSGSPIEPVLTLPKGWTFDHWRWPTPSRHLAPGDILDHVYEQQVVLLTNVTVPKDASPGLKAELALDASWLVCKDVCIPEDGSARVSVAIDETPRKHIASIPVFKSAALKMPRAWPKDGRVLAEWDGTVLRLRAKDAATLAFYPKNAEPAPLNLIQDGEVKGEELTLRFAPAKPGEKQPAPEGVVEVRSKSGGWESFRLELPPPAASEELSGTKKGP